MSVFGEVRLFSIMAYGHDGKYVAAGVPMCSLTLRAYGTLYLERGGGCGVDGCENKKIKK